MTCYRGKFGNSSSDTNMFNSFLILHEYFHKQITRCYPLGFVLEVFLDSVYFPGGKKYTSKTT